MTTTTVCIKPNKTLTLKVHKVVQHELAEQRKKRAMIGQEVSVFLSMYASNHYEFRRFIEIFCKLENCAILFIWSLATISRWSHKAVHFAYITLVSALVCCK